MQIALTVPDEMAADLGSNANAVSRLALEALAVERYRSGRLSAFQVRQMLGQASRWETEDFLAAHEVWPGLTEADLTEELRGIEKLRPA